MTLAARRISLMAFAGGAVTLLLLRFASWQAGYPHFAYLSGWGLLALMLFLTAYNGRKKLPFLPLVPSRVWFQIHVYVGLVTGVVFLLHLQWRWPTGRFEGLLAGLFNAVMLSGIFGWAISRTLPHRLTTAGGEVPYERIPIVRRALRDKAEGLVLGAIASAGTATLADFYAAQLAPFFAGPANFPAHLRGSRRPLNQLLEQIAEVKRFVKPDERTTVEQLADLVRQKDTLDFHRTMQLVLKGWLFVHIPLTYGLLLFTAAHVVIVYAFSGGVK